MKFFNENIGTDLDRLKNIKSNLVMNDSDQILEIAILEIQIAMFEIIRGIKNNTNTHIIKSLSNLQSALNYLIKLGNTTKANIESIMSVMNKIRDSNLDLKKTKRGKNTK